MSNIEELDINKKTDYKYTQQNKEKVIICLKELKENYIIHKGAI